MYSQSLSQKQTQKTLPKIIMQQNILAIPLLSLDNIIKRELELNPMLEEGSEYEPEETGLSDDAANSDINEEKTKIDEDDVNYESEKDKNSEDEYNWDEYFDNEEFEKYSAGDKKDEIYEPVITSEYTSSLKDSLTLQMHLSGLSDKMIFIGEEIIWSLNDEGFFVDSDEDILSDLNKKKIGTVFANDEFTKEELEETLKFIQNKIDPPGIAARSLKDCLILQIERSESNSELKKNSIDIIENHFEDLRLKRYENISKALNIDLQQVKEIFEFIQKLNPRPGNDIQISVKDYIIPDLIVKNNEGDFEISLNEGNSPSLRINRAYKKMYKDKSNKLDKDTKEFIVNNFNKAKWFIDAINSRKDTLLKIMGAIVERQRFYFENNDTGLKPMFEKEIAEDIHMDPSTVSRAVRGKYVQTPSGIHELRSFFTTALSNSEGDDVSNSEVKITLKELIDNEDKSKPLSDEDLSHELNNKGLKIARRTVAKYRESLNIPPSKLRREIL
ncbi:MAG TPA: RNA polymerase factor sigma-54 [Ignavibacteria bacterium]|nr:RNA polymerase factor sigma-54 [Ignavibacteria bacterium]HMR39082.1 RNA polymerase factor sigma-54 [Ignavibacteria bacterium]